jgi:hypothetical protein
MVKELSCAATCPFDKKCYLRSECLKKIKQEVAPCGYAGVRPKTTVVTIINDDCLEVGNVSGGQYTSAKG